MLNNNSAEILEQKAITYVTEINYCSCNYTKNKNKMRLVAENYQKAGDSYKLFNIEKSIECYEFASFYYHKCGDIQKEIENDGYSALCYTKISPDRAILLFEKCIIYYHKTNNLIKYSLFLEYLGDVYQDLSNKTEANKYYIMALNTIEPSNIRMINIQNKIKN